MKALIVLENVVMDGLKRATTVVGNALATTQTVTYYSLADIPPYYELDAPLVIAKRPTSPDLLNFFGDDPYRRYADQIADLETFIDEENYETVILPGGLLTSFAPLLKDRFPWLNLIAWMHNNVDTYMNQYYVQMQTEFKLGLAAADTVVTLTDSDLAGYSRYSQHVVKIYNPLTLLPDGRADLDSHVIAFTGRIAIQHKGIDYLLEAAQYLPTDWQIAIAGSGTDEDMQTFRQLINSWNVGNRIIYRGALHDQALQDHYEAASIFVTTSRWEGMPLVMGEAMGFGLPIVAMNNTGSAEYLRDNRYGILTKSQDVPDFVQGLLRLVNSRGMRDYYSQQSLKRVQHFTIEAAMDRWLPILAKPAQIEIA